MKKLLKAWTIAGSNPEYHFSKMAELQSTWPQLYEGIVEVLHQEVKETSIAQAVAEERERVRVEIEKYIWKQKSTAIWGDEYRDGFDHAFGGILEILLTLDKPLSDKESK